MSFRMVPPAYWTSKKELLEREMSRRREKEEKYWRTQETNSKYFAAIQTEAVKHDSWTSDELYKISLDAYKLKKDKEMKEEKMNIRKNKLKQLLRMEADQYEVELKEMSCRRNRLKKENRCAAVNQQQYPQRQQQQVSVKEKQVEDGNALSDQIALLSLIDDDGNESEEGEIKDRLRDQMEELKKKEQEADELKTEQDELQRIQSRLQLVQNDMIRRKEEQQNNKSTFYRHQSKLCLQHVSREIQKELEEDKTTIEQALITASSFDSFPMSEEATAIYKLLDDQLIVDKNRESEMSCMFNEEAWRLWRSLEREWDNERIARHHIISDFFTRLFRFLDERLVLNIKRQQNCLSHRDSVLSRVEEDQRQLRPEN